MTVSETCERTTAVYLVGDAVPVITTLTIDEVVALIQDMAMAPFLRLPIADGKQALIRPAAIAAIMPALDED